MVTSDLFQINAKSIKANEMESSGGENWIFMRDCNAKDCFLQALQIQGGTG